MEKSYIVRNGVYCALPRRHSFLRHSPKAVKAIAVAVVTIGFCAVFAVAIYGSFCLGLIPE